MKFNDFINKVMGKKVNEALDKPEKEEKPQKRFEVGDVLTLTELPKKGGKLPDDAYEFLTTYNKFTVLKVSEKGKIDIGCRISKNMPDGVGVEKFFIFNTTRFELADKELAAKRAEEDKAKGGGIKPLPEDDSDPIED